MPEATAVSPAGLTRLRKAAVDSGFDKVPTDADARLIGFGSTQFPGTVYVLLDEGIGPDGEFTHFHVILHPDAWRAAWLQLPGVELGNPRYQHTGLAGFPSSAPAAVQKVGVTVRVANLDALGTLLKAYAHAGASAPTPGPATTDGADVSTDDILETEVRAEITRRKQHDKFRAALLAYWGCCAVTGLREPELLRASHIKAWADCTSDAERLDVYNGLLLAPHLDAAFDRGFIGFDDDGTILLNTNLTPDDARRLGISSGLRLTRVERGHAGYLQWHRARWGLGVRPA